MEKLENGIYVSGHFIELTREKRKNNETGTEENVDYIIVTVGGRRGTFAIKFDMSTLSRDAFRLLDNMTLGDEFLGKVRLSAFNNAVYYTLEDVFSPDSFESVV